MAGLARVRWRYPLPRTRVTLALTLSDAQVGALPNCRYSAREGGVLRPGPCVRSAFVAQCGHSACSGITRSGEVGCCLSAMGVQGSLLAVTGRRQ
jgi:hypothetical protein